MKSKKKNLHSNLVRFFAQSLEETHKTYPLCDHTLCPTFKGGPCLNFAYFSMKFCNLGDPKGGGHGTIAPPLNTPLIVAQFCSQQNLTYQMSLLIHKQASKVPYQLWNSLVQNNPKHKKLLYKKKSNTMLPYSLNKNSEKLPDVELFY